MKTKICSLAGVIGDSRRADVFIPANGCLGDWCHDTAEIVPVHQISIAILTQGKYKL